MKGNLIIITSPSGGGKGTLIREILNSVPGIEYSVSLTTRAPRTGEVDGKDYLFVSKEEFERFREGGGFLEFAEVHGNFYGTSLIQTETITAQGKDVILEIDVQGAAAVMEKMPNAVSIFILPPSFEALKARLTARATESSEALNLRLKNAFGEILQYEDFEYVVVNDEIASASKQLESIILAERQKRVRQSDTIRAILDSFDLSKMGNTGE